MEKAPPKRHAWNNKNLFKHKRANNLFHSSRRIFRNIFIYFDENRRCKSLYRFNNNDFFSNRSSFDNKTLYRTVVHMDSCKRLVCHNVDRSVPARLKLFCNNNNVVNVFCSWNLLPLHLEKSPQNKMSINQAKIIFKSII